MKKNIVLLISLLLISTNFLCGCSNNNNDNNNSSNSKVIVTILDFVNGNLTSEEFQNVSYPPIGNKFVYVKVKVTNLFDKKILTSPFYITLIDKTGFSYMHFKASIDLKNFYFKNWINPGGFFQGGLIYIMLDHNDPIKLQYFDPINNINISLPLNYN